MLTMSYSISALALRHVGRRSPSNLVPASQSFDSSSWLGYYSKPVLTGSQPDPLGGDEAMSFSAAATVGGPSATWGGLLLKQQLAIPSGTAVTASLWARSSAIIRVSFGVNDRDIRAFTVSTPWQRLILTGVYETGTGNSSIDNRMIEFFENDVSNPATTIWIFGAQLVAGHLPLEYVRTGP